MLCCPRFGALPGPKLGLGARKAAMQGYGSPVASGPGGMGGAAGLLASGWAAAR